MDGGSKKARSMSRRSHNRVHFSINDQRKLNEPLNFPTHLTVVLCFHVEFSRVFGRCGLPFPY